MNNQQFRKLVLDTPTRQQNGNGSPTKQSGGATPAFGNRSRASVLMTPRNVRGSVESTFAQQLAARRGSSEASAKRFKSSYAPKGTKLAAGYHDRTQDRIDDESDEKALRIKALEEQVKLDQIDQATFESLRDEITGGDVASTHLVKGLDRRLLERVRRGEDVMSERAPASEGDKPMPAADEDDEFEALEAKEVAPIVREHTIKKGEMAPPPLVSGAKRKRDAILAELKASRLAAAEAALAAQPQLGSHFRKIGQEPRVEIDSRGREVLVTVGPDGKVKRKVRKVQADAPPAASVPSLLEVDRDAKPLGIEAAALPSVPAVDPTEDDDDIFEGVGAEYDPLAALEEDDDEVDSGQEDGQVKEDRESSSIRTPGSPEAPAAKSRSYFKDDGPVESIFSKPDDAAMIATLKKASQIASKAEAASDESAAANDDEGERLKRRAAMLASRDRDLDDIDMGFGSSRFDDAEEGDGNERIKLTEWKGTQPGGEGEDGAHGAGGGQKRKRGPKKRKGDKNSAADVLKAMERQAGPGKST